MNSPTNVTDRNFAQLGGRVKQHLVVILFLTTLLSNGGCPIRFKVFPGPTEQGEYVWEVGLLLFLIPNLVFVCFRGLHVEVLRLLIWPILIGVMLSLASFVSFFPMATLQESWTFLIAIPLAITLLAEFALYPRGFSVFASRLVTVLFFMSTFVIGIRSGAGLFDREATFVFSGPIPWGWLMGLGVLLSVERLLSTRKLRFAGTCLCFLFSLAMSMSKGPVVALLAALLTFAIRAKEFRLWTTAAVMAVTGLIVAGALVVDSFAGHNRVVDSFIQSLSYVAGDRQDWNDRTEGVRWDSWEYAIPNNAIAFLVGNGPEAFAASRPEDRLAYVRYPHNFLLEILDSYGCLLACAFAVFVCRSAIMSSQSISAIIVLFIVALSLSGDLPYQRYLLPWAFWALISKVQVRVVDCRVSKPEDMRLGRRHE